MIFVMLAPATPFRLKVSTAASTTFWRDSICNALNSALKATQSIHDSPSTMATVRLRNPATFWVESFQANAE
jgi:hypothetical protein